MSLFLDIYLPTSLQTKFLIRKLVFVHKELVLNVHIMNFLYNFIYILFLTALFIQKELFISANTYWW